MLQVELTLADVMRAEDVQRWSMVRVLRPQNVAEHSWKVAMLAWRLCQYEGFDPLRTAEVVMCALTHDLSEVLTGDLPSPTKRLLGASTKPVRDLEGNTRVMGKALHTKDQAIEHLIKCADLVESVLFLGNNAGTEHADRVAAMLEQEVAKYPHGPRLLAEARESPQLLDEIREGRKARGRNT